MIPSPCRPVLGLLALAFTFVACDGGTEPPGPPTGLSAVSGTELSGTVAQPVSDSIAVQVTDSDGRGVPDVPVEFAVTSGGGTIAALSVPRVQAGVSGLGRVPATTDGDGIARAFWTLGTTAGEQTATATAEDFDPVTFTATAEPGPPAQLNKTGGDGQIGAAGGDLMPFAVRVRDEFDNGVAGVTVTWEVASGGGNLSSATSDTDASGQASAVLTLGAGPGENLVNASVAELTPASFRALGLGTAPDPSGDEFSSSASDGLVPPDLISVGAARDGESLLLRLEFVDDVVSDDAGGPNVMVGFLDLDTDQDPGTGEVAQTDINRPGTGSTGLGVEFVLVMVMAGTGNYQVFDIVNGVETGTVIPQFLGNIVQVSVPLSMLGDDDGDVNLATVVGTEPEATDIAPDDGHLDVSAGGGTVAVRSEPPTGRDRPVRWGRTFRKR